MIIAYLIKGANKARYKIDKLFEDDGKDHPEFIRAIVGHTGGQFVNVEGVEITEKDTKSLYHVTQEISTENILRTGLNPNFKGRHYTYYSARSPDDKTITHQPQDPCVTGKPEIVIYPVAGKGDFCVEIDVETARANGCIFRQNQSLSVMTAQHTPKQAILKVWNYVTGVIKWDYNVHPLPLAHLTPRPPASGNAEQFYHNDISHEELVKQNALKRREGHETSSDEETKDKSASSSKDQRDIVQPQTIAFKQSSDDPHTRYRKCATCFRDNPISETNCMQCGHILDHSEESAKIQENNLKNAHHTPFALKIAIREKPRGDYFISENKRAKQYLDRAKKAGYQTIVEHMLNDPQRATDCKVGITPDCKYTMADMTHFDKIATEISVPQTRPYSQRRNWVGTEKVVAKSRGGSETPRFRADPVVAKMKLMERREKSRPPIHLIPKAGGNAEQMPKAGGNAAHRTPPKPPPARSRSAARLVPAAALPPKPARTPPRTASMEPPQFIPRHLPIGANPKHYSMANPPPPPTPRQVSSRLPSQPRPKPKGSPSPPPPPPPPKR